MGEVHLVIVVLKLMGPGQRVVGAAESVALSLKVVQMVTDIGAHSVPRELLGAVARVLRERKDAHALVVERVGFGEVEDVEFDGVTAACVAYSEEEPLRVAVCVDVVLQH